MPSTLVNTLSITTTNINNNNNDNDNNNNNNNNNNNDDNNNNDNNDNDNKNRFCFSGLDPCLSCFLRSYYTFVAFFGQITSRHTMIQNVQVIPL